MNVIIDGVEYIPKHSAENKHGAVKSAGQLMRDGRKHNGWSIAKAAEECGINHKTISSAECGNMTLKNAITLADAYGIPLEELARAVRRMRK